jgi:6-phosphogluconolactonase
VNGLVEVVESVPDAFARLMAATLRQTDREGFSLFLSGGPTAERCYRRLASLSGLGADGQTAIDWTAVDAYYGDERCVPPDHPDSNHRMAVEALLEPVGPVRSDHPMYRSGSPEEAAAAYQRLIEPLGRLDLIHLGMGPDGHSASLFAGSPALAVQDPGVLVVPSRDPKADNPHDRITLTLPAIARARLVVFTVSGESKQDAFRRVVGGEDLPASRVTAEQVHWLVDPDAVGDTKLPS